MKQELDHSKFLRLALEEAEAAYVAGQVPIGCVIVDENGEVIAQAHNEIHRRNSKIAHAEMLALAEANPPSDDERVRGWTLYSTVEPCFMCLGAIVMTHIGTIVWGSDDRLLQTHEILDKHPYLNSRRLRTIACPDEAVAKRSHEMNISYWETQGRPDIVRLLKKEAPAIP